MQNEKPFISSEVKLPETTLKAFILGAVLSMILASANAYLGLFAGLTISASIPAAVLSMAILRLFRNHNILENNIVQTSASAGESLAAGVIFTFPALVLMGYWESFNYWETVFIALCGGVLGVLFTIPLRSALIVKQKLKFPEGVATAEVLKTGESGNGAVKFLVIGGLVGALVKMGESGLKIWKSVAESATLSANNIYGYIGMNLSPALIAVGYIVGVRVAILVFAGGVISWWIGIPLYIYFQGPPTENVGDLGGMVWSKQIRYLGVGAMVVGGIWALISLKDSIGFAIKDGYAAIRSGSESKKPIRTEEDTPMKYVVMGIGIMIVPVFIIYYREIENAQISVFMALIMVIAGFLFSAVAGYMAGLVGSSNNPISGVTIATILSSALILLALLGSGAEKGPAAAILIGAVVCCAAAIAGDNMQDLKAGNILGATPKKQQIMQMVGVVFAALVLPLVLDLLNTAYGFGPKTPENPDSLAAPQATLMESVARGVFSGNLPWNMIYIGMLLGVLIIIMDLWQKRRGSDFRIPVLAVAVGLYLPFELDSAIMLGGIVAWMAEKYKQEENKGGLLFASGLITGEALIGIFLAIPVAIYSRTDVFAIIENPAGSLPGLVIVLLVTFWLYKIARGKA